MEKRLIVFLILSFLIFYGSSWLVGKKSVSPPQAANSGETAQVRAESSPMFTTVASAAVSAASTTNSAEVASESGPKFTKGADGWWYISRSGGGVNASGGGVDRVKVRDFWPQTAVSPAPQGFLATSDGTPIRVLASGYLVPLFDSPETAFPGGVVDIMKPFRAYYVIRKQDESLLVAEPPFTPQSRTFWARQGDCYVWATGLAAELKGNPPVYGSEEQARTGSQPLTPADKYTSTQMLPNIPGAEGSPPMSRLPLLLRKDELATLLCPGHGGELCWVNVAKAGDSIALSNVTN